MPDELVLIEHTDRDRPVDLKTKHNARNIPANTFRSPRLTSRLHKGLLGPQIPVIRLYRTSRIEPKLQAQNKNPKQRPDDLSSNLPYQ